ncbi:S-type pyocin domain-containing protein [Pantoea sp. FN0305]|uniref:S-type pyocin domain-containing protein n=1 Tax=Pantoea sp. FN0305 TaxID=3418559 RepID=UPI003CF05149
MPVRATKYGGSTAFFCGMMPGEFNFLEFYLSFPAKGVKEQKLPWKTSVKSGKLRPAGATVGSNTHDFIACFPPGSKQAPLYIAMTCVITAEKVRQRQAAENQAATAKGTTEAKARAEAKAKAAAEAKARAQAEAKAKAAAEAKARAQAEAKAKTAAEAMAKIEAAMPASNALILGGLPGTIEFTIAGYGTWIGSSATATTIAKEITIGGSYYINQLFKAPQLVKSLQSAWLQGAAALLSSSSLSAAVIIAGLWPANAGKGSDKVPLALSLPLDALTGTNPPLQPGVNSVELPVRASLAEEHYHPVLKLLKTGDGGLSKTVPVLKVERDEKTGLDRIIVPAGKGSPSRTILINPVPVNTPSPSHTGDIHGNSLFDFPRHLSGEIQPIPYAQVITTPIADIVEPQDFIYWRPDASGTGVEPVYVVLSNPYGETNAKGKHSGREFHTEKAGGPIKDLDWRTTVIDREGIEEVKLHTGRFAESAANKVMIERLEKILKGELQATDIDKRFYTHEIRELERYRNLGIKDEAIPSNQAEVWNNTHTATLEDYKINERHEPLYTPEAVKASEEQAWREGL